MELQYETDHKAGLQYATKVFYRNMGICKRKPVSVGRGDRTLCSKFIFYDSLFESCEQPASKHHTGDGHRSNGQGCRGKCPVSQYLKYNDNHIISSAMAKEVFTIDAPDLKVEDMDIGSALFYQLFGLLFILAAIVCSFLMLWTVYSRYIKLYLLMILAPFAMSALVGGQEIERSFYAWMRTFLLNAFEIVVIALTMVISFKLIGAGISLFDGKNIVTSMVDGFWDALNSLFTMILVTAAVKGSNAFLSKAMGL